MVEPSGATWDYFYDTADNLDKVTDPLGNTWTYGYDESNSNPDLQHDLLMVTGPNAQPGGPFAGDSLVNTYNSIGEVTAQTDPAGLETTFDYSEMDTAGMTGTTLVDDTATGSETKYVYQTGVLMSKTIGEGTSAAETWTYSYDPTEDSGTLLPTTTTDPNGNSSERTYDYEGNTLTTTDALGNKTTDTYNGFGELLTSTPPLGAETVNTYDSRGNLLTSTLKGSAAIPPAPDLETQYSYYPSGLVACEVAPAQSANGASCPSTPGTWISGVSAYTYDSNGDLASIEDPDGNLTTNSYNTNGDLYCSISPKVNSGGGVSCPAYGSAYPGGTTWEVYNADDELTSMTNPDGNLSAYYYDADGNQIRTVDPSGNTTVTAYDADDRVISNTTGYGVPGARTTSYVYDIAAGTSPCTSSISSASYCDSTTNAGPGGYLTVDYYDSSGRLVGQVVPPGGTGNGTTTYSYNMTPEQSGSSCTTSDSGASYCDSTTNGLGTETDTYDADDRLIDVSYSSGAPSAISYAYNADSERTTMSDETGTTSYAYDSDGRLTSETNGAGAVTSYGYDDSGDVTCISYPGAAGQCADSGNTSGTDLVDYAYDPAGNMTSATDWQGNTTSFSYDPDGNLTTSTLPNSDTVSSSYDNADLLQQSAVTPTANPNDTLAGMTDSWYPNELLKTETDSGALTSGATTYGYDPQDEVTTATTNPSGFNYNPLGEPTLFQNNSPQAFNTAQEVTNSAGESYGYDAVGNRISSAPSGGRPPSNAEGESLDYGYDQAGDLTSETVSGLPGEPVSMGSEHGLFLQPSGHVLASGENNRGQLGNGTTTNSDTPVQVDGPNGALTGIVEVAVPASDSSTPTSVALDNVGNVWTWGSGAAGELGNGTEPTDSLTAVKASLSLGAGVTVEQIAAGFGYVLALTSAGNVYSWGYNASGQLGSHTTTNSDTPVEVLSSSGTPLSGITQIAAGNFSMALDQSGNVWTWGDDTYGELGNGTMGGDVTEATKLSTISNVSSIAAGGNVAMCITSSGSVEDWGENNNGQLGNGTTTNSDLPVTPSGVSSQVLQVASGGGTSFALESDGSLYAWGANQDGQFGNGTTTGASTPAVVQLGASEVAAGNGPALRVMESGAVDGWGDNTYGELGIGNTSTPQERPVAITGVVSDLSGVAFASDTMSYYGDGLRMKRGTTKYTWDTLGSTPLLLSSGSGGDDFIYGPNGELLEAVYSDGVLAYYFTDPVGSVRALLGPSGAVTATYNYDVYGALSYESFNGGTRARFASGYLDTGDGLYYLDHRYYDPATGQFLSVDPAVSVTQQLYTYAGNDPVNANDPTGLWGWNPISDVTQAWNDTGGKAVSYVHQHQKAFEVGAGVVLGVAAAATGVGAIVEGATAAGFLLGAGSAVLGAGAAAFDYGPCVNGNDTAACVGLGLGVTGAFAGVFGATAAGLVAGGIIAEDSLAAAILGGIGAFGWNVGIAGTIFDATTGFASAASLCGSDR